AGVESRIIRLKVPLIITDIPAYRQLFTDNRVQLMDVLFEYDYTAGVTYLNFIILANENTDFPAIFEQIRALHPVTSATLANQVSI
ncbi:MAG: hypothetical protein K2M98_00500, partial [Muribaculum sp.]|nr:hypothetical protein [Muribaculum sp.]